MTHEEWDRYIREALALIHQGKTEEAFEEFAYAIGGNTP
jgi:hypothetical protein